MVSNVVLKQICLEKSLGFGHGNFCLKESLETSLKIDIVHILGLRELLEGEETRQGGR